MDLVSDFAYVDEALVDSFVGIEGRYGFDPKQEPELYDLGTVGEPVFGPRLTTDSRAALRAAFGGVELQFIADWRSFEDNRPVCDDFRNGRRALRLSAPMPHFVEGSPYLVAVNIDAGTCQGLTYILEVGWTDSAFAVWRIVQEGDWIAN